MSTLYNNIIIKPASPSDINKIAVMQINAWQEDFITQPIIPVIENFFYGEIKRRWIRELDSSNEILVIQKENVMLGFLIYTLESVKHTKKTKIANLKSVYISPSQRRNGLARKLCDYLFTKLKNENIYTVKTWVLKENVRAKKFYECVGFHSKEETRADELLENEILTEVLYFIHLKD